MKIKQSSQLTEIGSEKSIQVDVFNFDTVFVYVHAWISIVALWKVDIYSLVKFSSRRSFFNFIRVYQSSIASFGTCSSYFHVLM